MSFLEKQFNFDKQEKEKINIRQNKKIVLLELIDTIKSKNDKKTIEILGDKLDEKFISYEILNIKNLINKNEKTCKCCNKKYIFDKEKFINELKEHYLTDSEINKGDKLCDECMDKYVLENELEEICFTDDEYDLDDYYDNVFYQFQMYN